jgi:hypothetical protein
MRLGSSDLPESNWEIREKTEEDAGEAGHGSCGSDEVEFDI